MDVDDLDPSLRGVVRVYSLKVADDRPDDTLSQALGVNSRHELSEEQRRREESWPEWLQSQGFHSSDQALLRLERHKRQIAGRWKLFNSDHPSLQMEDIFREGQGPPRIDGLLRASQDAEATWEKKKESSIGKTQSAIENFMDTMNSHSYLFSIIPSEDKYTSLINGVLRSITKAFVNHKKIAELFSEALERITKDLASVRDSVKISNTPEMKFLVVDLYIAVFNFLCDAMDWYGGSRKRRMVGSLRQNYAEDIRKSTDKVKEALARIRLQADQVTQSIVQDTHQDMRGVLHEVKSISQKLERLEAAAEKDRRDPTASAAVLKKLAEDFMLVLGQSAMRTLVATGEAQQQTLHPLISTLAIEGRKSPLFQLISGHEGELEVHHDGDISDETPDVIPFYTRTDIQKVLAPLLEQHFEDGRYEVLKTGNSISGSSLPSEVAQKITNWIENSSSSFLWVEGLVFILAERQLSAIAVLLHDSALGGENPIPCVLFTPKSTYPTDQTPDSMSRQEHVLIAILYSIAGQLIQVLPEKIESSTHSFAMQVFEKLDGSISSASAALNLIESLLAYGPPTLMVIINRLQEADLCPSTTPHLKRFVTILKAYDPEHTIKVLFITQGTSPALAETMDVLTEMADARRMAQARPGQPVRGWLSLGGMNFPNQRP